MKWFFPRLLLLPKWERKKYSIRVNARKFYKNMMYNEIKIRNDTSLT